MFIYALKSTAIYFHYKRLRGQGKGQVMDLSLVPSKLAHTAVQNTLFVGLTQ